MTVNYDENCKIRFTTINSDKNHQFQFDLSYKYQMYVHEFG